MDKQNINTTQAQLNTPELDIFIDKLIKSAGLDLPQQEKQSYRQKLSEQAQTRLGITAIGLLNDDSMDEYMDLLNKQGDSTNPEEIQQFFVAKIANFEDEMEKALNHFAKDYLRTVNNLK